MVKRAHLTALQVHAQQSNGHVKRVPADQVRVIYERLQVWDEGVHHIVLLLQHGPQVVHKHLQRLFEEPRFTEDHLQCTSII